MNFEYFVTVRGYELDSFGHLNNAVYLNYIEQAQWEILKKTDTFDFFYENEIIPAIIEINIRYIREAKIFDKLVVKTNTVLESPYVVCKHNIYNTETKRKSCKAKVKQLYLTKNRIACDLPDYILKRWGII